MTSGRWRFDSPERIYYPESERENPDLLIDDITEVPGPPLEREDDPPELNEDAGHAHSFSLPSPVPVFVVPGPESDYVAPTAHGFTVGAFAQIPKQILSASDNRVRAVIRNTGGSGTLAITIGSTAEEARGGGYLLEADTELTIEYPGAVWGYVNSSTATDNVVISAWVEYRWPIG